MAEIPGLLSVALLIDWIGRRMTMGVMSLLCCAFIAPLATQLGEGLAITILFCARACVMGIFAVLHVFSPEVSAKHQWIRCILYFSTPSVFKYATLRTWAKHHWIRCISLQKEPIFGISFHLVYSPKYMICLSLKKEPILLCLAKPVVIISLVPERCRF